MLDKKSKPVTKVNSKQLPVHKFIATGKKPSSYKGSKPGFK